MPCLEVLGLLPGLLAPDPPLLMRRVVWMVFCQKVAAPEEVVPPPGPRHRRLQPCSLNARIRFCDLSGNQAAIHAYNQGDTCYLFPKMWTNTT